MDCRSQVHRLTWFDRIFNLGAAIVFFMTEALLHYPMSHLWTLGFGKVTAETLIELRLPADKLLLTIFIANSPQILLSCLYLTVNGLLTDMLLERKWSNFARHRAYLRVTSPKGQQRSTYWLQIPYKYAIPLLTVFGVLHWLVSQSLFLARVNIYDFNDVLDESASISTCSDSIMAFLLVIVIGGFTLLSIIALSFRRYSTGMPLAGSCSAVISAACHPSKHDVNASQRPVKWGAIPKGERYRSARPMGHCTITSLEVEPPFEGKFYAGWKDN